MTGNLPNMVQKVEMSLPDFGVISSFILASSGFHNYDKHGKTLASVLDACKEKLSSPNKRQYDFGMRKLHSIIKISATLLIKSEGSKQETESLCSALKISIGAMLLDEDCEPFDAILSEHGFAPKDFVKGLNTKATIPTGYTAE